jgi:hypothetical protein
MNKKKIATALFIWLYALGSLPFAPCTFGVLKNYNRKGAKAQREVSVSLVARFMNCVGKTPSVF